MIRSEIPCTHRKRILSIIVNACLNVVFLSITVNILSFGTTISVSTDSFIFANHISALSILFLPSKENGFVTIPTTSIHISFAICAITGPAPVPVHPPIHHVMNTMSVSCKAVFISASFSSADFLPISGFAPAQSHFVRFRPIFSLCSDRLFARS
jgi:hypothetical protein